MENYWNKFEYTLNEVLKLVILTFDSFSAKSIC